MLASDQNHSHLSTLLVGAGLDVVMNEVAGEDFIKQLEQTTADVLLVDLCDDSGSEVDVIDTLLEYDTLPVLFNDSSKAGGETDSMWAKKLARKLEQMVREFEPEMEPVADMALEPQLGTVDETALSLEVVGEEQNASEQIGEYSPELEPAMQFEAETGTVQMNASDAGLEWIPDSEHPGSPELESKNDSAMVAIKEESRVTQLPEGAGQNVWVLGASLGGPQAVRHFLMAIQEDLPVAFILAQHIGENHISLLAEQLDRVCKFKVFPGYNGHMVRHHEVILAPAGKNIHITADGYISLSDQPENAIYSPCINDVMTTVAERYGNMAGTIVFSGMGDDGAIGCQSIANNGGIVWAQDVDSCVISSMPDQARKTNNVTFSANPSRLADELYKYYME